MSNPLDEIRSTADKLNTARHERERKKAQVDEDIKEFKRVTKKLFSSPYGRYWLKRLITWSGVFDDDVELNPAKLIEDKGRKSVYLTFIRPYLDPVTKAEMDKL